MRGRALLGRGPLPRLILAALPVLILAACGATPGDPAAGSATVTPTPSSPTAAGSTGATPSPTGTPSPSGSPAAGSPVAIPSAVVMAHPGPFEPPLNSPDILVVGKGPLPRAFVGRARHLPGVVATERFSLATFYVEETPVTYAAVDPASFRSFTPGATATTDEVWNRVADGELALRPGLRSVLALDGNTVVMGNDENAQAVRLGALAELIERSSIDAVLNERWAKRLHMPVGNALLVSTGSAAPDAALKKLRSMLDGRGSVQLLALSFGNTVHTAVLTGGSVAQAVGSFTYTANPDGSVVPDSGWVSRYIRTETVPILGRVTCNKAILPQLRAALREIQQRGLAGRIHPGQYGGCYVPRYIGRDPSQGLSFHTWGTAFDLNVPENQRGTAGLIDRTVVDIFAKWGFDWGGRWRWTDPMHFELARLVAVR